jgi:hypothetical protein
MSKKLKTIILLMIFIVPFGRDEDRIDESSADIGL